MCAEMGFSRGRRGAGGEVRVAGEVVVESICFGGGGEVCVCIVDGEVKWAGGLEAAKRFMFK